MAWTADEKATIAKLFDRHDQTSKALATIAAVQAGVVKTADAQGARCSELMASVTRTLHGANGDVGLVTKVSHNTTSIGGIRRVGMVLLSALATAACATAFAIWAK